MSAAGHISSGDTSAPSARRELEEELGIRIEHDDELEYIMSVKASATGRTDRHGTYVDNEFQDIYLYWPEKTVPVDNMVLQDDEVESVDYWHWNEYCQRLRLDEGSLVPRSEMYRAQFFPWMQFRILQGR